MNIPPPPDGFVMDAPQAAPAASQIPPPPQGFVMDGPATQQPNMPAHLESLEETSRKLGQMENAERGAGGNLLAGAEEAYNGLAGGAERLLAHGVGMVSPTWAQNMRIAAARSESYAPQEGSMMGTLGNVVGGLPTMMVPGGSMINAANTGEKAYQNIEARKAGGENISGLDELANVAGQAGVSALTTKLGQKALTGKLATGLLPAALDNIGGRTAAKMASGALFNWAGNVDQRLAQKVTTDPNIDVNEGGGQAALLGAGMEGLGSAIHEAPNFLKAARLKQQAQAEQSPAAPLQPLVQQAGHAPNAAHNQEVNQGVHTPDLRQENEPTWDHSKNLIPPPQEGPRIPASEFKMPPREPQASDEAFKIQAKDKSGFTLPNSDMGDAFPKQNIGPQEGPRISASEYRMPPREAQASDEAFKIQAKDKAGFNLPNAEPNNAFPKPITGRIAPDENEAAHAQPRPNAVEEIQTPVEATSENGVPQVRAVAEGSNAAAMMPDDKQGHPTGISADKALAEKQILARQADYQQRQQDHAALMKAGQDVGPKDAAGETERGAWVSQEGAALSKMYDDYSRAHGEDALDELMEKAASGVRGTVPNAGTASEAATEAVVEKAPTVNPLLRNMRELATNESGGATMAASKKFAERDVTPTLAKTATNVKATWDSLNRAVGTGLNLATKARDTALNIRTSLGKQDLDRVRTEEAFKPYRDMMEKMTEAQKEHWVDQVEATGSATDPKTQPVVDQIRKLNDQNIKDGERYGLNTKKWDTNYIGRMAQFPNEPEGTGSRSSMAGAQRFLHGRVFDTYSDFKNAVEQAGGKMRYENPLDVQLAKQSEIRKSIEARKILYGEEDRGQMKWVEDGTPMPEGMDTRLNDPLAKQERPVVAPKWMVGKLSGLKHFDAQTYMDGPEWQKHAQTLRPGEKMPDGYTYTGQTKKGQFAANENVAGLFNNFVSPGIAKELPVWDQIVKAKRATVAANLGLSAVHAVLESVGNGIQSVGRSLSNVGHGEFDLAAKNLMRAMPWEQARFGKQIGEQAKNPSARPALEPLVQASAEGGNKFFSRSVLDESSWKKAKEEWSNGNPIGAVPRTLSAMYESIHKPLFDQFIPALRRGAKAAEAEMAIRRNMNGTELRRHMGLAQDDIDNMLGTVIRTHQFQNKFVTDLQDLLFTAPKFSEGTLRFAGAATRDTLRALKDVAGGKKPTMTPAMYTALGGLMAHAFGATLTQLAYTYATTGKATMPNQLRDYIAPRTGRKDDQGREERVSIMSPFSFLFSLAKGGGNAVMSRVAPVWHAGAEAINNADYRGRMIRNPNDSLGRQALDTAEHVGKAVLPFSVQNYMESKRPGASQTWDAKVGDVIGARFGHTSATAGEQAARDVLAAKRQQAPLGKEEAEKSDTLRELADQMRSKKPGAWSNIRQAVREGKITEGDVDRIRQRATEKPGLAGLLGQTSLTAKDVMEQVWPKMSAEERRANQWVVRGKIGRTETLTPAQRRTYFGQISQDVKAAVAK